MMTICLFKKKKLVPKKIIPLPIVEKTLKKKGRGIPNNGHYLTQMVENRLPHICLS